MGLSIPAIPPIAQIPTTPPSAATLANCPASYLSSAARPVNPAVSRGSVRVTAAVAGGGTSWRSTAPSSWRGVQNNNAGDDDHTEVIGPLLSRPALNDAVVRQGHITPARLTFRISQL
jgi:hypothetical protein